MLRATIVIDGVSTPLRLPGERSASFPIVGGVNDARLAFGVMDVGLSARPPCDRACQNLSSPGSSEFVTHSKISRSKETVGHMRRLL
jgi:hypothetical protein